MTARRALVLQVRGLSDLCTAVPALRALRRGLPDHHLALAAPPWLAPVVDAGALADELVPVPDLETPLPRDLLGVDLAVNLHGHDARSRELLRALAPGRYVGYLPGDDGSDAAGDDTPPWPQDVHEVDRWCALVGLPSRASARTDDLALAAGTAPPAEGAPVLLHTGAGAPARRWPPRRFAELARHLRDAGLPLVLTGTRSEAPVIGEMARTAGLDDDPHVRVLAGRTDLEGLLRTVAGARLVVSGDTGVGHLATALARPSVLLFGPTSPARSGPPGDGPHTVLWHGRTGDPHATVVDPGLLAISVSEVLDAVERRLRDDGQGGRSTTTSDGRPVRALRSDHVATGR